MIMKIKTQDLIGAALDWAVAKAFGLDVYVPAFAKTPWLQIRDNLNKVVMCPSWSTSWEHGGPIIGEMFVQGLQLVAIGHQVRASLDSPNGFFYGDTALIAAMRCYVNSKLGKEIEIPDYLLHGHW